ncbi:zinc knuckle CX2CX4HX4C [Artemisia annua]|uniref:Zinc knuckle CX2CX4HX4C n=1 Tax=Artemisia annua TaxID=35608 RepID=A0A2U1NKU5_ARTAN|nr:zinc knuckle CX2CX4HX4C [Artemisia annua]
MCMTGIGRLGFARVLVELNAEKQLKDVIEVAYKKKDASISVTKFVQVEYAWKPSKCSHYCVFGHEEKTCRMIPKDKNEGKQNDYQCDNNDGFKEVQYRKNRNEADSNNNRRNDQTGQNGYTRGKVILIERKKSNEASIPKEKESSSKVVTPNKVNNMPASSKNSQYKNKEDILGSNSFGLLNSLVDEEDVRPNNEERKQVDEVLGNNGDPTVEEWESWTEDMKRYYKDKKELLCAAGIIEKEEDIVQDLSETGESLTRNEIEGVSSNTLN